MLSPETAQQDKNDTKRSRVPVEAGRIVKSPQNKKSSVVEESLPSSLEERKLDEGWGSEQRREVVVKEVEK
ncbi:unnamed protein product, partial [Amoebophrya sp. A25]|eukprot:GSA25T00012750001.1